MVRVGSSYYQITKLYYDNSVEIKVRDIPFNNWEEVEQFSILQGGFETAISLNRGGSKSESSVFTRVSTGAQRERERERERESFPVPAC